MHRRVPLEFADVEPHKMVTDSLKTESKAEAMIKAIAFWDFKIDGWTALQGSQFERAEEKFRQARAIAQKSGFNYMVAPQVEQLPVTDILDRVEAVDLKDSKSADAILGNVRKPSITMSGALDMYWGLVKDKNVGKTTDQLRRFRRPRITVVGKFIDLVGDKALSEVSGDDMLVFRDYLMEKITDGQISNNTANKNLSYLIGVMKTVNRLKRLGLKLPVDELKFDANQIDPKDPFSSQWILDKFVNGHHLSGLNDEARAILHIMINTGARPSEIAGALPEHFELDGPIPMMHLEPEGRQLKNDNSRRKIPLGGVSLEAAKKFGKTGFPNYAGKDKVSATINKYLLENGLRETDKTPLYSLRHSFEDRMLVAGVDERVRSDILGHTLQRQRYGKGGGDERNHSIVTAVILP